MHGYQQGFFVNYKPYMENNSLVFWIYEWNDDSICWLKGKALPQLIMDIVSFSYLIYYAIVVEDILDKVGPSHPYPYWFALTVSLPLQ